MAVTTAPSPCLRCVDIDVLCPCESYRQWLVAAYPAEVEPAGCSRCQETEWLGLAGERFDQIAARQEAAVSALTLARGTCTVCHRGNAQLAPQTIVVPSPGVRWVCADLAACCRWRGLR